MRGNVFYKRFIPLNINEEGANNKKRHKKGPKEKVGFKTFDIESCS